MLVFLALAHMGWRVRLAACLDRAGKQARLHEPRKTLTGLRSLRLGARDRVAGSALRFEAETTCSLRERCANSVSRSMPCVAESCSPDLMTIRAKHGRAGSASNETRARCLARRGADPLANEIDIGKRSTCRRGCSTQIRSMRGRHARTCRGLRAEARVRVPAVVSRLCQRSKTTSG